MCKVCKEQKRNQNREVNAKELFTLLQEWTNTQKETRLYFRGEKAVDEDINYNLQPLLVRKTTLASLAKVWGKDLAPSEIEEKLIRRYKRYTAHLIESDGEFAGRTLNNLEILCLAQHYGLPTLLMDWSLNPLVALYFAIARDDTGDLVKGPGRLWVMKLKPSHERANMTIHLEDSLDDSKVDSLLNCESRQNLPQVVVPLVFTKRIAAQEGRFVYCPFAQDSDYCLGGNERYEKDPWNELIFFSVPEDKDAKLALLDVITRIGFHAGRIFPDLSGWAKYLRQGNM